MALKDWSDIDVLAIPYEGKILLEQSSPLTEEDLRDKDIGLRKPHAPDYVGKNKFINMEVTAINKSDTDNPVILSYVSSCLEPQMDSIQLKIPARTSQNL